MSVWDVTTPAGSEAISLGDDRIRELKVALTAALTADGTFPGASPSTTPIFIPGVPRDTTANRPTGDRLVSGRLYVNTTLNILERYNGSSWDSVGTVIPSGTKMLFYQASAPTGWTGISVSNRFLRVVNIAGTGGTTGGSGLAPNDSISLAHSHTVNAHTHTVSGTTSSDGAHTHTVPETGWGTGGGVTSGKLLVNDGGGAPGGANTDTAGNGVTANSNGSHTHTYSSTSGSTSPGTDSQLSNIGFLFADVIVASKD